MKGKKNIWKIKFTISTIDLFPYNKLYNSSVKTVSTGNSIIVITNATSLSTYYLEVVVFPTTVPLAFACAAHVSTRPQTPTVTVAPGGISLAASLSVSSGQSG